MKKCQPEDTLVSLKEYVDINFALRDDKVKDALTASEKRLDLLNEYRQQSADRDANFVTKDSYEARYRELDIKIDAISKPVWIGIGMAILLSILIPILFHYIK